MFFKYHPVYTKDLPEVKRNVFFSKGDDQRLIQEKLLIHNDMHFTVASVSVLQIPKCTFSIVKMIQGTFLRSDRASEVKSS